MKDIYAKNGKNENEKNGNGSAHSGNGNGKNGKNGNGNNGTYSLESIINESKKKKEKDFKGNVKEFLISGARRIPLLGGYIQHIEGENKKLKRTLLHVDERDINPRDMSVKSQYDAYLQKITRMGVDSAKFIRLKKEKDGNMDRYRITAAREMDQKEGLSSKLEKYPKYIDFVSGVLSSVIAYYMKPFEMKIKEGEAVLNEFDFSEGDIKRKKSTIHWKTEAKIINSYLNDKNKKDYRKYETPVFDDENNLIGITTIKESPIKLSDEEWDFNIFMIENEEERFVNSIKKAEHYEETLRHATRDELTDTYNRRYFEHEAVKKLDNVMTFFKDKLIDSLIMIDIDNFKQFNDKYGHDIGDRVLKEVARTIKVSPFYERDVVARLGGEEFAVYLQGTPGDKAMIAAERIRNNVEKKLFKINEQESVPLTVSCGVSDTWMSFEYMKRKTSDSEFNNENSYLYEKFRQFKEKHEAYKKMLKNKEMDSPTRDGISKSLYHPKNLMILYKALYKTADIALYDAKRDGRNKSYLFDLERDYSSKNLHSIELIDADAESDESPQEQLE